MSSPAARPVSDRQLTLIVVAFVALLLCAPALQGQRGQQQSFPAMGGIPLINVGADAMEARFARLQFAQMYLEEQAKQNKKREQGRKQDQKLVDSGLVSALDLAAPGRAVDEFNKAATLLKEQHAKEAIPHLQKALATYPKFISAHNNLGLAYMDVGNPELARNEFAAAAQLDAHFPVSFVNLARLALMQQDFAAAERYIGTAAQLAPRDASILTVFAYAQNGAHEYRRAISTAERVHALDHKGSANVHYVAAVAAVALGDAAVARRELEFFVREDPTNALAPVARQNLEILSRQPTPQTLRAEVHPPETFPNSQRLQDQLAGLGNEDDSTTCAGCEGANVAAAPALPRDAAPSVARRGWTFRKSVDEVTVFFSVTNHGRIVDDLQASDILISDDGKPPAKLLEFDSQARLPLRLGLLVDTSGSVDPRFAFEKDAAVKFLQTIFSSGDLGFVAGFADQPAVTQDFTADTGALARGVSSLNNGGGTALFDAVSYACWKLAAYPERERVARVLVVLGDGEDNSSHDSLKQAIADAEATGVTVYTISTKSAPGDKTDADKVMAALAERTGGEALFPDSLRALGNTFARLHDLIRSRYMVAYKPADFRTDGSYRTITIMAQQAGKRLQVHARKGYHARLEPKPGQ